MTQSLATKGRAGLNPSLSMSTVGVLDTSPEVIFEAPLIVNVIPAPGSSGASLLRPISMTIRDQQSYVDLSQLSVSIGYAKAHSDGDALFDLIPHTKRLSLVGPTETDGLIAVTDLGVLIAKNSNDPQKTVYATSLDVGFEYRSVMLTATVRRDISTLGPLDDSTYPGLIYPPMFVPGVGGSLSEEDEPFSGTVIGMEHGPRGRALYLWLQQKTNNTRIVRLTSYIREGLPNINEEVNLDWTSFHRFTILWNESEGFVDVYAKGSVTDRIFRRPITDFPTMPNDYRRISGVGDIVGIYGQEGSTDSRSLWTNIALATDVGHPIRGSVRTSNFLTQLQGPEFWKVRGSFDPRSLTIGPWFAANLLFQNPDPIASSTSAITHFRMSKMTLGTTYALYRREPGLKASDVDGFVIQAKIEALGVTKEDACTGMGITVFDGQTVFQLLLFEDDTGTKRLGILRAGGQDADNSDYYFADLNWSSSEFRLVVDPRENFIRIFDTRDLGTPILDVAFNRDDFPSGVDKNWDGEIPFISIGHTVPTQSAGIFALHNLIYSHLYQGWCARDNAPTASDPAFSLSSVGSPSLETVNGATTINCDPGELASYSRVGFFSSLRGVAVETRVRVTSHRSLFRTGTYLLIDDGIRVFALSFVDSRSGKYAALTLRDGTGGFRELVGRDGDGAKYSFPCDWTDYHIYRLERQVGKGFQVYLDAETSPRISFPENDLALLPNSRYSGIPTIAFGQITPEGSISQWSYLNTFFSRGYEISIKKNKSDAVLREELYNTQAIIVASASDG